VQQTLLGEAADDCHAAIFVYDDEGRYVAVNRFACELLGYSRDELLALRTHDLAPEDNVDGRLGELLRAGALAARGTARAKDGRIVTLSYRSCATRVGGTELWVTVAFPE
jgi:PAS domain S-box-containing protein